MQQSNNIHLRLARESDFQVVLKLSEGIYDGADFIPVVFHDWLKTPNKLFFMAELQEKAIGLVVANVVSDGRTFFAQALRIHPKYRGQGLSYHLMSGVTDYIRRMYPEVSKMHYTASPSTSPQTFSIAKRRDDRMVKEQSFHYFQVKEQGNFRQELSSRFKKVEEKARDLFIYDNSDVASIITNKDALDFIAQPKIMIIRYWEPYEAIPSNIEYIFRENDKMFADVSIEELKQGKIPKSFSHGCLVHLARFVQWNCMVYANDLESFRAHFLRQLKSATEIISNDFEFCVDVGSKISSSEGRKVLEEVLLALQQNIIIESDTIHLFEKLLENA